MCSGDNLSEHRERGAGRGVDGNLIRVGSKFTSKCMVHALEKGGGAFVAYPSACCIVTHVFGVVLG